MPYGMSAIYTFLKENRVPVFQYDFLMEYLFAADGDILDIRAYVRRMWIAGKEVTLESRHTRLYQKYQNRPRPTD